MRTNYFFSVQMSVSKEGKADESVHIAHFILSHTAVTTVKVLPYDFLVKFISYLVTIANRNQCRLHRDYKLKLITW